MHTLKQDDKTMIKAEKLKYVEAWESASKEMLEDIGLGKNCGVDSEKDNKFVTEIFLVYCSCKELCTLTPDCCVSG